MNLVGDAVATRVHHTFDSTCFLMVVQEGWHTCQQAVLLLLLLRCTALLLRVTSGASTAHQH
jgi:hypothetical protein